MSRRPRAELREYVVSVNATLNGGTAYVQAASLAEAQAKAKGGEFCDGPDMRGAEMVDWEVVGVQLND